MAQFDTGAWQAAALYNSLPKPEKRYPVITGGDSAALTADHLRELCQLPSVPPVTRTTTTTVAPLRNLSPDPEQTVEIADVNYDQYIELRRHTEGDMECVWFQGKRRLAWLAQSLKREESEEKELAEEKAAEPVDTAPHPAG